MSDSKDMHINESILSDEIREDLKKNRTNHMEYLPDMEVLESDIQQKVIDAMNNYDYDKYTAKDVLNAINKSNRTPEDFAALLSPAALPYLEDIPIGSNRGVCTKDFIQILIDEIDLPIIVDAGIGRPSQACEVMEMGAVSIKKK